MSTTQEINAEDLRIVTMNGEPAVELPDGKLLRLSVFVDVESQDSDWGDRVEMTCDVDHDEFPFWTLEPENGEYPRLSIEPELLAGSAPSRTNSGDNS